MLNNDKLVTFSSPKSPVAEAYRVLRTNIQFSSIDNPLKTVLVTSSGPGEGKTTTVSNLAIVLAQSGAKVLLIDADLRKPKIHKVFDLQNQQGLTSILAESKPFISFVNDTVMENLHIITCGPLPPNPSELLGSKKMKAFIEEVKGCYDMVLLDTPPAGTVTDAVVMSTVADGVILVAASGQVTIDAVSRAKGLLTKVNANIIGVVLNKLEKNANGNYYYYYYYYYGEDERKASKRKRKAHAVEELEGL